MIYYLLARSIAFILLLIYNLRAYKYDIKFLNHGNSYTQYMNIKSADNLIKGIDNTIEEFISGAIFQSSIYCKTLPSLNKQSYTRTKKYVIKALKNIFLNKDL